jgi:hypothetical protein
MKLSKRFDMVALLTAIALGAVSCGGDIPTCGQVSCESSAGTPEPDGIVTPVEHADPAFVPSLAEAETAFTPDVAAPQETEGGAARG